MSWSVKLPDYFAQLVTAVELDHRTVTAELQSLTRNIDHIKVVIASRRAEAKSSDVISAPSLRARSAAT